jgi:hypothetical protein
MKLALFNGAVRVGGPGSLNMSGGTDRMEKRMSYAANEKLFGKEELRSVVWTD